MIDGGSSQASSNGRKVLGFVKRHCLKSAVATLLLSAIVATSALAQDAGAPAARPALPPIPTATFIPRPGPAATDGVYQPLPILLGGVVIPVFPPDSKYLNPAKVKEPEVYSMNKDNPGRVGSIVGINNPSIEFHGVDSQVNTGMVIILAAGGGHNTLNVGTEACDFVPYFRNFGIASVILRNRLRRDGYNPQTDEVYDALQAIRLVRAHAKEFKIDPKKIGIMGFSAGAELATAAGVKWGDFDGANNDPTDPLAGITSRPDFIGDIYPGPSPYANGGPAIPANMPPSFIVCAGSGDSQHANWADQFFAAMLAAKVPNIEMHIYARGHHPGDQVGPGEPPSMGGLNDRGGTAYGKWGARFIDWAEDLGFLGKPGVETTAARDAAAFRGGAAGGGGAGRAGRGAGRGAGAPGGAPAAGGPGGPAGPGGPGAGGAGPGPGGPARGPGGAPNQ